MGQVLRLSTGNTDKQPGGLKKGGQVTGKNLTNEEGATSGSLDYQAESTMDTVNSLLSSSMLDKSVNAIWETEPILKDILLAIKLCNLSVTNLTDQVHCVLMYTHNSASYEAEDVQKYDRARGTSEEIEDNIAPLSKDMKKEC